MPTALLMKPSGATLARLDVEVLPDVLEHGGERWQRSHTTVTGAAYQVQRVARPRATGLTPVPKWIRLRR